MIKVNTSGTPIDNAGNYLKKILNETSNKNVLLLFSGGSAMALIDHIHPNIISKHHTISVLDERYTFNEKESNFSKLENTTFFKEAIKNGASYIDPRPLGKETLKASSKRFDIALKHWHVLNRDGVVIATVGIGPDGHTSGILPMPENTETFANLFMKNDVCAVGYETTPDKNPHTKRITTTATYIMRHIDHAIIYATGKQKKDILQKLFSPEEELANVPARILQKVKDAQLFTDLSLK